MFRTMLVEDHPGFRKTFKVILQSQFPLMDIVETVDGVEALRKVETLHPDLIFMDIGLPGENGLELTRKIKSNHPTITIVILTSYDSPEYRETAMQYKTDYFLSKASIAGQEILTLVEAILSEKGFNVSGSDGGSTKA
jgi:DNA-binding NarL/FixJ family response regulator